MRNAPEKNRADGDECDEPMYACEAVFYAFDGDDGRAFSGLEGDEK